MKTNQEILDRLGNLIITDCFDKGINFVDQLRKNKTTPQILKKEMDFVKSLTEDQVDGLKQLIHRTQNNFLFNFLKIFEEYGDEYKIIYKEENEEKNLVEISEMLKAEHMIDGGWIERFSKYADDYEI